MMTLEQSVGDLINLFNRWESGEAYSESRIDTVVDGYLVRFGADKATKREELAEVFSKEAPVSELSERMRKRISRKD